ncbi:putative laccase-4-like, partial [Sesbania bispinosa]
MATTRRRQRVLQKVWLRIVHLFAPYAWLQIGSIAIVRPFRTELAVMLANPIASAPPASSIFPWRPKKSIEMADREYKSTLVIIIGHEIFASDFNSSFICI